MSNHGFHDRLHQSAIYLAVSPRFVSFDWLPASQLSAYRPGGHTEQQSEIKSLINQDGCSLPTLDFNQKQAYRFAIF